MKLLRLLWIYLSACFMAGAVLGVIMWVIAFSGKNPILVFYLIGVSTLALVLMDMLFKAVTLPMVALYARHYKVRKPILTVLGMYTVKDIFGMMADDMIVKFMRQVDALATNN